MDCLPLSFNVFYQCRLGKEVWSHETIYSYSDKLIITKLWLTGTLYNGKLYKNGSFDGFNVLHIIVLHLGKDSSPNNTQQ